MLYARIWLHQTVRSALLPAIVIPRGVSSLPMDYANYYVPHRRLHNSLHSGPHLYVPTYIRILGTGGHQEALATRRVSV